MEKEAVTVVKEIIEAGCKNIVECLFVNMPAFCPGCVSKRDSCHIFWTNYQCHIITRNFKAANKALEEIKQRGRMDRC